MHFVPRSWLATKKIYACGHLDEGIRFITANHSSLLGVKEGQGEGKKNSLTPPSLSFLTDETGTSLLSTCIEDSKNPLSPRLIRSPRLQNDED